MATRLVGSDSPHALAIGRRVFSLNHRRSADSTSRTSRDVRPESV